MTTNAKPVTPEELLREMAQCLRKAGYQVTPPESKVCLVIIQWKKSGDAEGSLDLALASNSEETKQMLRRRHNLTDTNSDPDQPNSLQIIHLIVLCDNQVLYRDGERFLLRILKY